MIDPSQIYEQLSAELPLASAEANAIDRWPEWFHRRVETIDFDDVDAIRRSVRLDFSIPGELSDVSDRIHVPVALVPKRDATSIEVTDEAGAHELVLTSVESRELGGDMLVAHLFADAAEGESEPPAAEAAELLQRVALQDDPELASELLSAWERTHAHPQASQSLRANRAAVLATRLVSNELVFVSLSPNSMPRRVLTLRHEESLIEMPRPKLGTVAGWRHLGARIGEGLGWRNIPAVIDLRDLGSAESVDFVVNAPPGVRLRKLRVPIVEGETMRFETVCSTSFAGRRSFHFSIPEMGTDEAVAVGVELRAEPSYPAAVAGASLFGAAVLAAGLGALERLDAASDAGVTLLLGGPTLFASLIAQPGRGAIAAQTVRGARILLGAVALATFIAAASLAMLPHGDAQKSVWAVLTGIVLLFSFLLLLGLAQRVGETRQARKSRGVRRRDDD
ncbi:MAG: hypothetical protein WA687_07735 [Solirubrobacterales bacterium]